MLLDWGLLRSATSARLLAELGAERGLPVREGLRGTGIAPSVLADPDAEVTGHAEMAVVRNLVSAFADVEDLGVQAGLRYHLTTYGIAGFAFLSSATLRGALEVALGYLELTYAFNPIVLDPSERGTTGVVFDDRDLPPDVRRFLVERDIAAVINGAQETFTKRIPIRRLELRFPPPAGAEPFAATFGVRPHYAAPANRIVLDDAVLDGPLPQANEAARHLAEQQCRELLARRRARGGVASDVRGRLLATPGAMPAMDRVAHDLAMSNRTLRRRLADEGTSFRALVDETREALADELLRGGQLTIEQVADRLGYAEPSVFTHAFKRWKGMSPRAYRQRAAARAAR
jgi:AraC-like DNA-binding protein